jgi:hypothetical protein
MTEKPQDDSSTTAIERSLASALKITGPEPSLEAWSRRTRRAVRPILTASARRAYRRRVAGALAAACVPLPLIALYARALLGWLHDTLAFVLPAPLADVAVASYAAMTALLVSATLAAVPILVEVAMRTPRVAHGD